MPADAILLHQDSQLVLDESSITGESRSVKKTVVDSPFLLSGTKVIDGTGIALIVAIGADSFHGKMMMAMSQEAELTPLQIDLNELAERIAKYGLALAVALLISLIVKNFKNPDLLYEIPEYFIAAITIIVVAVPEGLPMAVTLALAFATNRMLRDNNLVRVLASCETMGRVTSICSDKTGTLTENRMTVVRDTFPDEPSDKFKELVTSGIALNSTAFESVNEDCVLEFVGSSTEAALLRYIKEHFGASYNVLRRSHKITHVIPFSSVKKLMITCIDEGVVFMKGAAEVILDKCDKFLLPDGSIADMTDFEIRETLRKLSDMSADALKNIGLAFAVDMPLNDDELLNRTSYIWIGAVGIEDPLRPGVPEAVKQCQDAGIFVRMVTGDNRATAESIARRCGLLMLGGLVMDGPEFRKMPDDQLVQQLPKLQVLARSSPLDKQRLVRLLRDRIGEIVAVTGDGSNDGPALKAAHVGFSMGITGTQLAQEASSIVLLDDNFASIVKAVSWGRCVTRSVRKFLQFQLTVNVAAVCTAVVTALTTSASVLTAVQMLWVNLIMDSLGALALATDSPTPDLLQRPPESPDAALIKPAMYWNIAVQSAWQLTVCLGLFYLAPDSIDPIVLRGFTFNTFVFLQLFNEINCRALAESSSFSMSDYLSQILDTDNYIFWVIWWSTLACQLLIVQFGGPVFSTTPLPLNLWLISLGFSAASIPISIILNRTRPWRWHSTTSEYAALHPTREQMAWHMAVRNVQARLRFYNAIRRRIDSGPIKI